MLVGTEPYPKPPPLTPPPSNLHLLLLLLLILLFLLLLLLITAWFSFDTSAVQQAAERKVWGKREGEREVGDEERQKELIMKDALDAPVKGFI